jgi:hypothetical protein
VKRERELAHHEQSRIAVALQAGSPGAGRSSKPGRIGRPS